MRGKKPNARNRQTVQPTGPKADMNGEDWLTPREAAQYLRVGVDLIYDACAAGGLKHVKLGYRTIRVRRAWIDMWADAKAREFG
jgi:excisionase family DNA binding protein